MMGFRPMRFVRLQVRQQPDGATICRSAKDSVLCPDHDAARMMIAQMARVLSATGCVMVPVVEQQPKPEPKPIIDVVVDEELIP